MLRSLDQLLELYSRRPPRRSVERLFVVLYAEPPVPPLPIDFDVPTERAAVSSEPSPTR